MAISEKATQFIADNFERGKAIPGQSLTNAPEEAYNWERPTEFTNPRETMLYIFETLTVPETTTNILLSLNNGVGVIDIASTVLYSGFLEGKWNPDLMTLMMEPTMYMIMALAEKADVPYSLEAGVNEFDRIRKQAMTKINPQSVPEEIKQAIEETEIPQSLLDKVEKQPSNSLLGKEE